MTVMQIGFHLTPFWSPTDRSPTRIIDEAIGVIAAASKMGYGWVSVGNHWLSHPTIWPQPIPLLARLAPETGDMLLKTSVILLPLFNAIDMAETIATLDHITHGRLIAGFSIGYREQELEAVGLERRDRVPKLEESIELMKQLWTGEEVTFEGRYTKVIKGRMGFTPFQKPHPPLEMGAQSEGATRRAARITDGVFFGPQVAWRDVATLANVYRDARQELGKPLGMLGASRSLMLAKSKDDAKRVAEQYLDKTFNMYRTWSMQERGMVELTLGHERGLDAWAIHGSAADCVETILRARDECGLNRIGFTIYSLPPSPGARIEYLQMIAEDVVAKVVAPD
ncbi:MAG TPA: LLM class flavin-dependent oxidoreductase [Dehalococcoidia bacterium]|nr:LLM class flavin-dependent oxidoreductase [Dehalococcoidia bacterium]